MVFMDIAPFHKWDRRIVHGGTLGDRRFSIPALLSLCLALERLTNAMAVPVTAMGLV
jgi:hypothetical protein